MKSVLLTGSSGFIGSEAVLFFDRRGWAVHGIDNNLRMEFFGPDGDTAENLLCIKRQARHYRNSDFSIGFLSIVDREGA